MIVEVDLTGFSPPLRLGEPADFTRFHVRALVPGGAPDWDGLRAALGGFAEVRSETAFVAVDALRRLAGRRASDPEWQRELAAMLGYAERKGWIDAEGAVSAHVEWQPEVPIEPDSFRDVLGHFPTGVAIVTGDGPRGPVGMTCNSLTSVSLSPPLIAVCPAKSSETWPRIRESGRFVVNLMASEHQSTVRSFARKDTDRMSLVPFHPRRCGPALDAALAWIECALTAEHDAGDHTIALGEVVALEAARGDAPLVFFRGRYGTFAEARDGGA
jgi:3-hydroxy-9,10-secoandrosta-1,3,5(10)-triene-9,17-dione monooxygenase reductase component